MALSTEHLELIENGYTICSKCGTEYCHDEQDAPDDATTYWVPSCPDCGEKMTGNPTNRTWLRIISSKVGGERLDREMDDYEWHRKKLHYHSRLYHGRLAGLSTEELVRRAKYFDRQAKNGKAIGPRFYRDIAFNLRRQARRQG